MKIPLFGKKHAQNVHLIESENFLLIDWDKKLNQKNANVKQAIERTDKALEGQDLPSLSDTLPYLTFTQAEELFAQLLDVFDTFTFKKLSVVHREDEKHISTKGEVFASPFILDDSYENLLIPLTYSLFKEDAFKEESYEDKRNYLLDDIYASYQNELGVDDYELPEIPTEEEVASGEFTVYLPEPTESEEDAQKVMEDVQQNVMQEVMQNSSALSAPEMTEEVMQNVAEDLMEQFSEQSVPITQVSKENTDIYDLSFSSEQQSTEQSTHINQNVEKLPDFEKFPRLPIQHFPKDHYEPYEQDYVAWRINEMRKEENRYIEEKERANHQLAQQSLNQQIYLFEQEQLEYIQKELSQKDRRNSLKEKIMHDCKEQEEKAIQTFVERLESQRQKAIEDERRKYESILANLNQQYDNEKNIQIENIKQEWFKYANQNYQNSFYEETANLQRLKEEKLQVLKKQREQKVQEIENKLQPVLHKVGSQVYNDRLRKIEASEKSFVQQHEYAKHQQWLKNQELSYQAREIETKKEVEALKETINSYKNEQHQMEERLLKMQEEIEKERLENLKAQKEWYQQQRESLSLRQPMNQVVRDELATSDLINRQTTVFSDPKSENEVARMYMPISKRKRATKKQRRARWMRQAFATLGLACILFGLFEGGKTLYEHHQQINEVKQEQIAIQDKLKSESEHHQKKIETQETKVAELQKKSEETQKQVTQNTQNVQQVQEQVNQIQETQEQQESYTFPIVEGGTPTDSYFTGTGKIVNQ